MKRSILVIFAIATILTLSGCIPKGPGGAGSDKILETIQIVDALGRKVDIPVNADKFAAIGPGALRLYCYVADTTRLVGVENFEVATETSGKPYLQANMHLKNYPVIGFGGPGNTPDAERLTLAGAEVIFTMYNYEIKEVEELQEKTGIPVVALSYGETELFDPAIGNSIMLIGKVTGNEERAREIVNFLEDAKTDLLNRTSGIPEGSQKTVYLGAHSMGGMFGIESTTGNYALFNALQAINVVDAAGIDSHAVLDKEKLLELDPDIIFLDAGGLHIVKKNYDDMPGYYAQLSAFSERNVHRLLPYNYYYTNLEIALANTYYIGKVLYPGAFLDIDPAEKFDEITVKMLGAALYKETAERYGCFGTIRFE